MMARPTRRGAALTEMVLALPFLVFVLVALLFFGRGAMQVQRTDVAARYASWREALRGQKNGSSRARRLPRPALEDASGPQELLLGKGVALEMERQPSSSGGAGRALIAAMPTANSAALAEKVQRTFPHGDSAELTAAYPVDFALGAELAQPIRREHTRVAGGWRYGGTWRSRGSDSTAWPSHGRWGYDDSVACAWPILGQVLWPQANRRIRGAARGNACMRFVRGITTKKASYSGPEVNIE